MKPRTIRFSDQDWDTMTRLAKEAGQTVSNWVHLACQRAAEDAGETWQGGSTWGDASRFQSGALEERLSGIHIDVANGRARIARRGKYAHNWQDLEDAARAAVEAQGGSATMSAIYDCPPELASLARF